MEANRKAGKLSKAFVWLRNRRVAHGPTETISDSLKEQGIDKHLADRARKAAPMPESKFEAEVEPTVRTSVAAVEGDIAIIREAAKPKRSRLSD
jgi:hypothetical protein